MLVLASASPRRKQLLSQINVPFRAVATNVEETLSFGGLTPVDRARKAALMKATTVAGMLPSDWVLGSDTVVVVDDQAMGKPRDYDEAFGMLCRLQGRTHTVVTAIALVRPGRVDVDHEITTVWIRQLSHDQIYRYIKSGEPFGKAGAYAIQGRAGALVERIEGCYYNIMGLPLARLVRLLESSGMAIL